MILDDLSNAGRYKAVPRLYEALQALMQLEPEGLPADPVNLGDDVGHLMTVEFLSRDPAESRFENHQKFFDVHCVFEGAERVDVADLDSLTPTSDFDTENDIGFHEGVAQVSLVLGAGKFLVCFPEDAHKPGMWVTQPETVRKVVAKILV